MSTETQIAMPLKDWQAEMEKRGKLDCKFRCPQCGNEASPADWKAAGGDLQRAPQECIGRLDVKLGGCNWAAFGLIDICSTHIDTGGGKATPVFAFADADGAR
jgi:hypothetical protein